MSHRADPLGFTRFNNIRLLTCAMLRFDSIFFSIKKNLGVANVFSSRMLFF
jgi:hypothetical protein